MWQYRSYLHHLDAILGKARAKYLGQEMKFTEMVSGGERLPPDALAKHVAQQLTVQLGRIEDLTDKELFNCYWWLRSAALYILQEVAQEDHNLRSLVRISKLSSDVLTIMVGSKLPARYADAIPHVPEIVKENLEEVIWLRAELKTDNLTRLEHKLL